MKYFAIVPLVALLFAANLAAASNVRSELQIKNQVNLKSLEHKQEHKVEASARVSLPVEIEGKLRADWYHFVINGEVKSVSSDGLVVSVKNINASRHDWAFKEDDSDARHLKLVQSGDVTVKTNSETKIKKAGTDIKLNQIVAGDKVMVIGRNTNGAYTATHINVTLPKGKISGEVTAKTNTTVTVKNNVTGETKTVTVTPDTQVKINGEIKAVSDIQVGDKGMVKFKVMVDTFVAKFLNLFR